MKLPDSAPSEQAYRSRIYGASLAVLALIAIGCENSPKADHDNARHSTQSPSPRSNFNGGCGERVIYAQNRWPASNGAYGAAVRPTPRPPRGAITENFVRGIAGNDPIIENGWAHVPPASYPNNVPPFDSDVWFHTPDDNWVSFPGVRGETTSPAPGNPDGGSPAPTPANCEGAYVPAD